MMTDNEKLLEEWVKRLGLTDWRIKLNDGLMPTDMSEQDAVGCAVFEESSKTARIEILDEKYYGVRIVPYDYEKTLVHELLHLKLSLFQTNVEPLQERLMHQIIDDLARAFVDAKRKAIQTNAKNKAERSEE